MSLIFVFQACGAIGILSLIVLPIASFGAKIHHWLTSVLFLIFFDSTIPVLERRTADSVFKLKSTFLPLVLPKQWGFASYYIANGRLKE
jgi:hypothetical protein